MDRGGVDDSKQGGERGRGGKVAIRRRRTNHALEHQLVRGAVRLRRPRLAPSAVDEQTPRASHHVRAGHEATRQVGHRALCRRATARRRAAAWSDEAVGTAASEPRQLADRGALRLGGAHLLRQVSQHRLPGVVRRGLPATQHTLV